MTAPDTTAARAKLAEIERDWSHGPTVLLRCGEMTAQELRTAKAVAAGVIRDMTPLLAPAAALPEDRWYLAAMNDGLFIIDAPPSPAGTDAGPHVKANGPTLVLNVTDLPNTKAKAVVDAHNTASLPPARSATGAWRTPTEADKILGRQVEGYDAETGIRCIIHWGKHNHVPIYGWVRPIELHGEEVDGFDPTHIRDLPPLPPEPAAIPGTTEVGR